ncbi:hypothetical protein EXIGLDRAFT_773238 [Exidia glandulosa HHB12029]|uniref:Protein kinase domain-containing protein n=1 Tax=Exidia glandulosa HHB12029 TaxID=1314781 RepID=A0A165EW64_EXIGL|nr:hypothetical protein EXIGLDRAFT_773238 [Exidia glandulosa HHB12029]
MSTAFVHPFDIPDDETAREALLAKLRGWERGAENTALETISLGAEFTGDLPASVPKNVPPCASALCDHFLWPEPRPHSIQTSVVRPGLHLTVVEKMPTAALHAQVYVAATDSGALLAVKIYQPKIAGRTELELDDDAETWSNVLQQYRREHWAYDRMRALQGVVVPYVYGFFMVDLPHGEPAVALVMEYIVNDFEYVSNSTRNTRDTAHNIGLGLVAVAHAIVNCDVAHEDLAGRNVLWPRHSAYVAKISGLQPYAGPLPVVIDFAFAGPIYDQWDGSYMMNMLLRILTSFGVHDSVRHELVQDLMARQEVLDMFGFSSLIQQHIKYMIAKI